MEPHDELFEHDTRSMPTAVDPAMAAKLRAEIEKADKAVAAAKRGPGRPPGATKPPKAAAAAAAAPSGPTASSMRRRDIKLQKIRLYFTHLGHKLVQKEPKSPPKSDQEVDELLSSIECELHGSGGIEKAGVFVVTGAGLVEKIVQQWNPMNWDLSGPAVSFQAAVAHNQVKWNDLVTEFAISNAEWFMVGPGKRLLATAAQLLMAVDSANKVALHKGPGAPAASPDLQAEAATL
jgi:hypothetical protein